MSTPSQPQEGLLGARVMMVLSSMAPLFLLWALRGAPIVPDFAFAGLMVLLIAVPSAVLRWRLRRARQNRDYRVVVVGASEDHRDHLLVYLFAMLLPFYAADLDTWRDLAAAVVGLSLIGFVFYHLDLHYLNLSFALKGYRVYTVVPNEPDTNSFADPRPLVVITKRPRLRAAGKITALRISDTVLLEE